MSPTPLPATMRAYRLEAWEQPPALVEVPVPVVGPGQVLVRVAACGLCHSDLDMMAMPAAVGEAIGWQVPFTLGHESAGWIAAVGAGGGRAGGAPVAVSSPSSCGRCRWCLAGRDNACPEGLVGRGYGRDGGLADYVLVDDVRSILALDPQLDPALAAPLTDAGATSFHAVRRVLPRVRDDGTVVVLGVGGLGAFVVQILRATTSARVVAVDPDPVRRDLAARFGAAEVVDGVDASTARALRPLVGEGGADAVIDLVGTDDTLACALRVVGAGGAVGVVGAAGGTLRRPWFGSLPRDGEVFTFQGSDLADARSVLDLAAAGAIEVPTVEHALDDVAMAYDALRAGGLAGRLLVRP
jgi:propanol-preferring alcohol dehydrogenase